MKFYKSFILLICILFLFLFSTGCSFVKYKVLQEKEELSNAELVGIWYHREWYPTYQHVAEYDTWDKRLVGWIERIVKENKQFIALKKAKSTKKESKLAWNKDSDYYATTPEDVFEEVDAPKNDSIFAYKNVQAKFLVADEQFVSNQILVSLGEEQASPSWQIQIYLRPRVESRWKLILSPTIEAGDKDPQSSLFEYLTSTLIKNIENIQGKVGIGVDF